MSYFSANQQDSKSPAPSAGPAPVPGVRVRAGEVGGVMRMIQESRLILADRGDASDLTCPRCGGQHLHHLGVTVYARGEDGPVVIETETNGSSTETRVVDARQSANPSCRREGLAIKFACECCYERDGDVLELTLAQHKGAIEVGWRFAPS
jgi:hypothetical protein